MSGMCATGSPREIGRAHVWNSSHVEISYAVFCLKKKKINPAPLPGPSILLLTQADVDDKDDREAAEPSERRPVDVSCLRAPVDFLFEWYGDHRDLHSFPTRRSSD